MCPEQRAGEPVGGRAVDPHRQLHLLRDAREPA